MATTQSASFKVSMDATGVTGGAADAAKEVQNLTQQLNRDKKAVNELQAALKNLKASVSPNTEQIKQLEEQLSKKKESIASAQSSIIGLGGSLKKTKFGGFKDGLKNIASEAKNVGGPLGALFGRVENLSKLAGSGAVKWVALGGAILGIGGACVYAAKSLFDLASASGEARREENLQLQSQLSLTKGIGDTEAASKALQSTIDQVSGSSAASRDAIAGLGKDLYAAGLRGGALEDALQAAATVAAVQGPAAADKFVELAKATDAAGGSVAALANKVDKNIGGIARQKLLSTEVQAKKLQENIGGLFSDVDVSGLLKARKGWTDLFSGATESGKAFKAILEPIGQTLIDGVTSWTKVLQKAVVKGLVWALKLETGWLKFKLFLSQLIPAGIFDGFDGKALIIGGVTAALIALGIALAPIVASAAVAAAPFLLAAAAVAAIVNTIRLLIQVWDEWDTAAIKKQLYTDLIEPIVNFADKIWEGAKNLGKTIIEGLVGGIKAAATWYIDTLKNLGSLGWKAFKAVLGISSPSKEFAKLGTAIPQGVKQGVDKGKPAVDQALINLVDPNLVARDLNPGNLSLQGSAAAAGEGLAAGGAQTTTNNNFTFNVQGDNAKEITGNIEDMIRRLFSVTALQMGAA